MSQMSVSTTCGRRSHGPRRGSTKEGRVPAQKWIRGIPPHQYIYINSAWAVFRGDAEANLTAARLAMNSHLHKLNGAGRVYMEARIEEIEEAQKRSSRQRSRRRK